MRTTKKGKTIINTSLLLITLFILIVINATGDLTCWIEEASTCAAGSQGTELLHMKNKTGGYDNAHAQQVNYTTPYNTALCCNSTGNVVYNSSGTAFLNLSADTDAHVQAPNETTETYAYPALILIGSTSPECNAYISGCPVGYTCLIGMSSRGGNNITNAHVGSCDEYDTDVCCKGINSPPNTVTLLEPFNGNATLFNKTITFQWLNTTDPDGDTLTYEIQVKQCSSGGDPSNCNPDAVFGDTFTQEGEIDITGITEGTNITEYISTVEVAADVNYTWRVIANDGTIDGSWSENWTFMVPSTVMFTIFDENMSFGSMTVNEVNDTTDNSPFPFRVRNDGNVLTDFNITVDTADDWLWDTYSTESTFFQYSIDNATAYTSSNTFSEENASFNWSDSATTPAWFNIPLTNFSANIRQLNYSDVTDEAEIDVRIQVPSDEPAGDKGSTVTITGWVAA